MEPGKTLESMAIMRLMREISERLPGGRMPDNYVVFDTETTGVELSTAKILQYGFCIVVDRKPASWFSQLVTRPNLVIPKEASDIHGITAEKLNETAIPASQYVPHVVDMMQKWVDDGLSIVGHNLYKFDIPLFQIESAEFGKPFRFDTEGVIDTGMMVKAAQLGANVKEKETLRGFYSRISEIRAKAKWSLDRHCYDTYNLGRSGVKKTDAHDAANDCRLTHCLLETLRQEVER
jgi:DNA polymerase III epsilon subunit-like protein